jgi:2-polyprenyl-6-methoxyphenol hydroxylase-like FAD-dependent oxidoreductase
MRVLIAGSGVGGLCLAQGLRGAGIEVTVFERDTAIAVREQGYRIHIDDNGGGALQRCLPEDLFELYLSTSTKLGPAGVRVLDHKGRQLAEFPPGTGEQVHTAVNRLTLREILAHGLDDALRFDAQVTGFVEHDDRVEVCLANGDRITGDVLVAADGSNSLIRKRLLPDAELIDTGLRCVYGRTPLDAVDVPAQMRHGFTSVADGRGHSMALAVFDPRQPITAPFLTPVTGYLMWAVITRATRWHSDDPRALHELATKLIKRWQPALREFVARAEVGACLAVPIRSSVPVPPWPTGRTTLLGDAIHAMTPAGGKGANTALRDAALLTAQLTEVERGTARLGVALGEYEARMREYGFAAVTESLRTVEAGR